VPFSAGVAVTLSEDENKVAAVPNPVPAVAVKTLPGPQLEVTSLSICRRKQLLLPSTLQVVIEVISPPTVQLKVDTAPGQVGGAAVNCPAALSTWRKVNTYPVTVRCMFRSWCMANGRELNTSCANYHKTR